MQNPCMLAWMHACMHAGIMHCVQALLAGMGCAGGLPEQAWLWFTRTGVVTGGDFSDIGTGQTCVPYQLAPCAQEYTTPSDKYPRCPAKPYATPDIGHNCTEKSYGTSYNADKKMAYHAYSLRTIAAIQRDIMQHGSATAVIRVHLDFMTYKSGVYHNTTSKVLGGHAVKLIGWGAVNSEEYWLVANSWNDGWGDHGYVKIRRGTDECGIESQVSAGTVKRRQQ